MVIKKASAPIFTHYADEICACSLKAAQWKFSDSLIYDKLIIVKNGIDTTKFFYDSLKRDEIRKSMNIPQNTYVLGHVGRFTYEKNQKFLIDLFEKYAQVEKNSYLILVGDGENKEKIFEDRLSYPWNWIPDSWTVCTFYCDSNYICSACIFYGSYCFE